MPKVISNKNKPQATSTATCCSPRKQVAAVDKTPATPKLTPESPTLRPAKSARKKPLQEGVQYTNGKSASHFKVLMGDEIMRNHPGPPPPHIHPGPGGLALQGLQSEIELCIQHAQCYSVKFEEQLQSQTASGQTQVGALEIELESLHAIIRAGDDRAGNVPPSLFGFSSN
ncbi:hypothetical protein C8J56DRAFT_1052527 [Mycena floridula]|nr:hypothetical protein C8J56DRAFT_1052527 [Mycena floridula]